MKPNTRAETVASRLHLLYNNKVRNMNKYSLIGCLAGTLALSCWPVSRAMAAGNAAAGANVFQEDCAECHSYGPKNKKGPSLRGIVGRKAGTAIGYDDYSDVVKKSNLIWTAQALDNYLMSPKKFSPTIRMKYEGLSDAKARADLIEFLSTKK